MSFAIDHVVFAAPDLDDACAEFEARSGVTPLAGGPHAGMGTRNALAGLGEGTYVELIAPDPATATSANHGGAFARLPGTTLFTWALRSSDLPGTARALGHLDLETSPIRAVSRETPDGARLRWELMGLPGVGGAWPFFIDWRDAPHPSLNAPAAGQLSRLEVSIPVEDVAPLPFHDVEGLVLGAGPARLTAVLATKSGELTWTVDEPSGFFP